MSNFPSSRPAGGCAPSSRACVADANAITAEAVLAAVRSLYAELHRGRAPGEAFGTGSSLERDLGIDSLARIELARRLEDRLRLKLPAAALATLDTVGDLLRASGAAPIRRHAGKEAIAPTAAAAGAVADSRASPERGAARADTGTDAARTPPTCAGPHRRAHLAYGIFAWLVVAAIGLPAFLAALLVPDRRRAWYLTHRAAAWVIRICGIPMSADPFPADLPDPHVLVVNHCSYIDAIVVLAVLRTPHRFVATGWLGQVPLLGAWLRKLGTIFIDRTEPIESGGARAEPMLDMTRDSLVVFPEGTFTAAAGLRPFHLGGFEVAAAARVPVIPVALRGTRAMLRDGQMLLRRCPVTVTMGAALECPGDDSTFSAAVHLRDAARDYILRYCGEPDRP
jgi:1-acyl-sn-glycerol-3-phosphate acyltransferase